MQWWSKHLGRKKSIFQKKSGAWGRFRGCIEWPVMEEKGKLWFTSAKGYAIKCDARRKKNCWKWRFFFSCQTYGRSPGRCNTRRATWCEPTMIQSRGIQSTTRREGKKRNTTTTSLLSFLLIPRLGRNIHISHTSFLILFLFIYLTHCERKRKEWGRGVEKRKAIRVSGAMKLGSRGRI